MLIPRASTLSKRGHTKYVGSSSYVKQMGVEIESVLNTELKLSMSVTPISRVWVNTNIQLFRRGDGGGEDGG